MEFTTKVLEAGVMLNMVGSNGYYVPQQYKNTVVTICVHY